MTSSLQNPLIAAPERPLSPRGDPGGKTLSPRGDPGGKTLSPRGDPGGKTLPESVAVVGAGTIGPDIGYYLLSALPGLKLYLVDVVEEALDKARGRVEGYAAKGLAKGKLSAAQAAAVKENLFTTLDYGEIAGCDWVIEAATESLELKHRIFAQIEEVVREDALLTSNTSSLPASRLFSGLKHKGRSTVTHFFAPAFRNPAVEVVRWRDGAPEVVEYLRWLFCATGKVPLVTEDVLCFMLDRIFDNWCNEAAYLLKRATAAEVDSVAGDYVHAGPFFVLNLAHGNPIIVETNTLQMEEGEHYRPASIFRSVKSWDTVKPGHRVEVDDEVAGAVRDRLLGILFSQSVDVVDRGIGAPADLDLGCLVAFGFKQGPLRLMEELGDGEVRRIFARLAEERPGMPQPRAGPEGYRGFLRHVLVDEVDGAGGSVKVLTLRRPQALNALDDEVNDELLALLREHEDDPRVAGFVITGYGNRAFSAGADIGRFPEMLGDKAASIEYSRHCSRLLVHLDAMRKPVVAALNGMALGGGLELALRCRGIVAVRDAWLQLPEVTLGIVPGIGGMVVPYRRWPAAATLFHDMIRQARKLKVEKAHELGVVDGLADSYESLIELAVARVGELAGAGAASLDGAREIAPPPLAEPVSAGGQPLSRQLVDLMTRTIGEAAGASTLAEALEIGYAAFGESACTAAAREGIRAFQERRRADFTTTG